MTSDSRFGFFDLVVGRYLWTIAATIAVIAVFAAGALHLTSVEANSRDYFNEDHPQLAKLEDFEETYAVSGSVLVVVAPPDNTVFTREALVAIQKLTEALLGTPYSVRVDSITNYLHTEGTEDSLIVEPLVGDVDLLDMAKFDRLRKIALTTKETAGRFVSDDGRLAGLIVSLAIPDEGRNKKRLEVVDAIHDIIDGERAANLDIGYHVYGELLLNRAIRDAVNADMLLRAPLAFAMIVLVALLLLRSVWSVFGILAMLLAVTASSFGFAGWSGLTFYAESGAAIFVLLAISVAHSVHLIQGMLDEMHRGMKRDAAIKKSLQANARPIFFTSVTTMIGFLSLNFSGMPPFQVMGNIVAFGAMCAFVYSMTLLPAILAILPIQVSSRRLIGTNFPDWLGNFVVSRSTMLLMTFLVLAIASLIGVSRITLDDNNSSKLLDESYELRRSGDFISENFSGLDSYEYSLDSGHEGGITNIDYLRQVDAFSDWLLAQPEVAHVTSIADIMKRLNQNLHADRDDAYALPDNSDLAAQYLLLYEFSLPIGRDLNNLISFDRSATRMTVVVDGMSIKDQIALDRRASEWLQNNAPQLSTGATGATIVGAYSVMRNIQNMLIGTFIAMALVSLFLIFAFRSLRFGLLSLVPNFLPPVIAMGIWGFAVGSVSFAASIVTVIAFAIVVDDTIHIMSKYLKLRAEGKSPAEAIAPTFRVVGKPLLSTTLIFALAFFIFGSSGLWANQTLGLLVGMTVIIALLADFLLFPPLLIALERKRH